MYVFTLLTSLYSSSTHQALCIWWLSIVAMATWWTTCTGTSTPCCSTTLRRTKTTAVWSLQEVLRSARGKGAKEQTHVSIQSGTKEHFVSYLFVVMDRAFMPLTNKARCNLGPWMNLNVCPSYIPAAMCLLEVTAMADTWTWVRTNPRCTCPCKSR